MARNNLDFEERRNRLYKDKYIIACYDETDFIVAVFNNAFDLSISQRIPYKTALQLLSKLYHKKGSAENIFISGVRCKIHFIKY